MPVPPYPTKIDRKLAGLKAHAFVADADTYFGKVMCNLLLAQNYTITATLCDPTAPVPPYVHQVVTTDTESLRPALLACDVIVFLLHDSTDTATRAIRYLMGSHYEVEKTFILVSSVLTWAATTPLGDGPVDPLDPDASPHTSAAVAGGASGAAVSGGHSDEGAIDEVSERMFQRRVPHPAYAAWKELEKLVRRANSETLHTYVVFSGLMYGDGEDALMPVFRLAWQTLPTGVPLLGSGANYIPTIHVRDLARYCYLLSQRSGGPDEFPRYVFAVDHGRDTWATQLQRVADVIGNGVVTKVASDDVCLYANPVMFTLNLVVAEDGRDIDSALRDNWHARGGLAAHADLAALEFRHAHGVIPMRVCVLGPPASGKSYYATQLAARYNVRHLTTPLVISEFVAQERELSQQLEVRTQQLIARRKAAAEAARGGAAGGGGAGGDSGEDRDSDAEEAAAAMDDDEDLGEGDEAAAIEALQQRVSDIRRVLAMRIQAVPAASDDKRGRRRPHGSAGRARTRLTPAQVNAQQVQDAAAAEARAQNGRFTSRCLALMWRWILQQPDVRNRGYVMDGFPRTVAEARLVFERMSAEELAPPDDVDASAAAADDFVATMSSRPADDALFPDSIIVLQSEDAFLADRVASMAGPPEGAAHDTPAGFERRLAKWRERALTPKGLLVYLDSQAAVPGSGDPDAPPPPVHPSDPVQREAVQRSFAVDGVPLAAAGAAGAGAGGRGGAGESPKVGEWDSGSGVPPLLQEMMTFLGPPRHFGATPEDIAEEKARLLARERVRREEEEAEREREADADAAVFDALAERRAGDERLMMEVTVQEEAELALRKAPLKDYLMEHIVPTLAKGLVEVCERRPEDPIDYLADWLFRYKATVHGQP